MLGFLWYPLGRFFISWAALVISESTATASNLHPMQCHLHKNVENVTNSSQGSTGLCEVWGRTCSLLHKAPPAGRPSELLPWAERAEGQEIPGASPGPEAGLGGEFQAHPATCWTWDMGCELDSFLLSCAPWMNWLLFFFFKSYISPFIWVLVFLYKGFFKNLFH